MELHEYAERDATDLAALIAGDEATRAEVEACTREAAHRLNPELNFLAQPLIEPLPGAADGPFAGVPFLTKDLVLQVEGVRQRAGSRMLDAVHFAPPGSAVLFERFRAAGLTLMGTTTTPEFGFNATTEAVLYGGPTRNPFDPTRSPGGSSGGAAAAVAAGVVPLAHANDGGGSIRIPAASCGLFGLKPSRGRTPLGPAFGMPLMGMAAEFVVTRSVRDAATLLQAVQGDDPGAILRAAPSAVPYPEAMEAPTRPLRIALADWLPGTEPPEPEMAAALRETARLLEGMGHAVEEAAPAYDHAAWDAANRTFWFGYLASSVAALTAMTGVEASRATLEAATLACAEAGRGLGALDYEGSAHRTGRIVREWGAVAVL